MNLQDILNTVPSWRDILDKIDEAVQDYNAAIADPTKENPADYLREWLPQYWQAVRAINSYQWERREERLPIDVPYDVGIFLVGFSSIPIVLSIAEIQPRQEIYFIHSNDTRGKCDEITNRFTEMLKDPPADFSPLIDPADAASLIARVKSADRREIAEPSDPVSTFQEIKDIIDSVRADPNLGKNPRIALDLTGGKKTMIGGGFTAGSIYSVSPKCDMFYVDSLEYEPDRGAPKPGTEFLSRLDNPYDVYNVQTVAQAEELFEKHNYEAAAKLWERIDEKLQTSAERYGLDNEHQKIERNLYMANCYGLWDAIDYVEADKSAEGNLWDYDTKHTHSSHHSIIDVLEILSQVPRQVSSQVDAVTTQGEISPDEARIIHHRTLFADEARIIHYAIDRYQNGIRRMDSDRSDDAIVRFAQVIEILCLYQLYRIADKDSLYLNNSKVSSDDCLAERWGISGLILLLFGQDRYRKSKDVYYYIRNMQLNISEYDDYTDAREITDIIDTRHDFVHVRNTPGWRVMEENAKNLKDLAREFLENFSHDYCAANYLSFHDLLRLHEFQGL